MKNSTSPVAAAAENPIHERILGAAFKAFTEEGYAATSTLDIATGAKVSKRDLYANFGSKHAVLVACIKSRVDRMRLAPDLPTPRSREMLANIVESYRSAFTRKRACLGPGICTASREQFRSDECDRRRL